MCALHLQVLTTVQLGPTSSHSQPITAALPASLWQRPSFRWRDEEKGLTFCNVDSIERWIQVQQLHKEYAFLKCNTYQKTFQIYVRTSCLKNVPTYVLLCVVRIGTDFNKKIGRLVLKEALNKTVHKIPTSPKICASPTVENLKLSRSAYMYI